MNRVISFSTAMRQCVDMYEYILLLRAHTGVRWCDKTIEQERFNRNDLVLF